LLVLERSGEMSLWSLESETPTVVRTLEGPTGPAGGQPGDAPPTGLLGPFLFEAQGARVIRRNTDGALEIWELGDPPDVRPSLLRRRSAPAKGASEPGGWLATNRGGEVDFWPLTAPRVRRLGGRTTPVEWRGLAFTSDSRRLVSHERDVVHLWPMDPNDGRIRTITCKGRCTVVTAHPSKPELLVGSAGAEVLAGDGSRRRALFEGWEGLPTIGTNDLAYDQGARRAVAVPFKMASLKDPKERAIRVFDLASGQERIYSVAHLTDASWMGYGRAGFAADGRLLVAGQGGIFWLTLPKQTDGQVTSETLFAAPIAWFDLSADGRFLLAVGAKTMDDAGDELVLFDLVRNTSRRITTHGSAILWAALDPTGRIIATGSADGAVRVGPATGEEPHLLLGHSDPVMATAISPDGRWIASAAGNEIRLWPMPDVTKPPLHTLPHAEFLARLDTWTNLRVVPDPTSPTGWKLDVGPFPGWKDLPEW
jgi:hypothetical protein